MLAKNSLVRRDRLESIDIVKVRLVKERNSPYRSTKIKNSEDIVSVAKEFLANEDRETFITINLDNSKRINSIHVVSVGSVSATAIHQREIFKAAILSNASCIILAHNHPSGDPTPSPDDIQATCKLFECGDLLGIEVLDHIIMGDDRYVNFAKLEGKKIWWESNNFKDRPEVS